MTGKDVNYWCNGCSLFFPVRSHIAKDIKKFNKKAYCPKCNSDKQTSEGRPSTITRQKKPQQPKHKLTDAASMAQLRYIRTLGGDPSTVKTMGEAGKLISELKKANCITK